MVKSNCRTGNDLELEIHVCRITKL